MNDYEKFLVQAKHNKSQDFIKGQNSLPKNQRDQRAILRAKKVANTTKRWLSEK
jgi:hypothetical protein